MKLYQTQEILNSERNNQQNSNLQNGKRFLYKSYIEYKINSQTI